MWWMLFPRWICFVASVWMGVLPHITSSHAGMCPNEMNPNLWVDAMSTCTRECESDQECESFEKCCQNVCGNHSCVAARYAVRENGPAAVPMTATCAGFTCTQQGAECDIWDGQPLCKCRDRCEREPHFTCASDGMTYYNKCYMDAEACSKGISLSVVTCRFHLAWLSTSPAAPPVTTLRPTTASWQVMVPPPAEPQAPTVLSVPVHQTVNAGDTASFLCDVTGVPPPEITWEKQLSEGVDKVVMGRNHVQGNMVVTNAGQLVIYSAKMHDSGVYTCTARNPSGSVRAHHALMVLPVEPSKSPEAINLTRCPAEECLKPPDDPNVCGSDLEKVSWFYDSLSNNCISFTHCHSSGQQPRKSFETYDNCMQCCGPEVSAPCDLPSLQGPCKAYEPRWAYISSLHQCQSFIYGGCGGNDNNFESKEACEEMCPYPKSHNCKTCKPRGKIVTSFCRSDFVVLGRMTEFAEEKDSGHALVTVEEILKDEKMGLRFFGNEPLEVNFINMDWNCPCPNITSAAAEGQVIIMGNVNEGMAVLQPDSYVGASSPRRVRKLRDVISKNTCDILKAITNSP
ncbi:WAP, Kazal, immunoglobulin, Kunitz and NTR domain-containing protein 2 [Syngnathus scovelli]|uniref:WAP, Kazal, immunoglobulin, Kunitz and NTR domain-containing protein 2 n=1 Tax=Syngnathus scovelli TaxID=161590 RepID=UPI00210F7BC3|nr:WAP, Kazal, immunoglobulin, Kunitz and NTR domain-containing protein 2 [Syngnathus scovelli]